MIKTQHDYAPHDAENLAEGWTATSTYADDCLLIAFDGCHKIYLAMDEIEASFFRNNYEFTLANNGENDLMDTLAYWYETGCGLQFISAVWHDHLDPNAGFVRLISQSAESSQDEDEDEDEE